MTTRKCQRCGNNDAGVPGRIPFREPLREQVREAVCASCWNEWLQMQIKIINELALNLGDPRSHEIIETHARDFLGFTEGESGADFDRIGEEPPETEPRQ